MNPEEETNHDVISRLRFEIRDEEALLASKRKSLSTLEQQEKVESQIATAAQRLTYLESRAEAAKLEAQQAAEYPEKQLRRAAEAGVVLRQVQKSAGGLQADHIMRFFLRSRGWHSQPKDFWSERDGHPGASLQFAFLAAVDRDLSPLEPQIMSNLEHLARIQRGEVAPT